MTLALSLAESAEKLDEVPVGALIVKDGKLISTGINLREMQQDPTAHAELVAIRKATKLLNSWRLVDCTLYVTLEPCVMCAGAISQSRIGRVVFGTHDPKGGGLGSLYEIHQDSRLNHNFPITAGIFQEECAQQLKSFFKKKRKKTAKA